MLDANYIKHLKVLGKLCYLWDQAVAVLDADGDTLADRITEDSALYDQVATGASASIDATELIAGYAPQLRASRPVADSARKTLIETITANYLTNSLFRGDLTATPANASSAQSVLWRSWLTW
jgi:hypothetical protein